jgi:GT2 family glycosyltransferase
VNPQPTCSVCIANYNGVQLIDACIASVRAQDCDFAVEIIVHDDASSDGSAQYIREHYPAVTLLESSTNAGFCAANNRMAAVAHGDYLLLLNNDAELLPAALATLHREAQRQTPPAILSLPQYDFASGALVDRGCLLDPFLNPVPNLDAARCEVATVIGACLWIPRRLWDEIGGFPEWFGSIAEDMYLCCRARLQGHPVRVPDASGYRHRQGASFGGGKIGADKRLSTTLKRRALSERNKTFVLVITTPSPLLWVILPIHLLTLGVEGLLLSLIKRDPRLWHEVYAHCFTSVWRERARLSGLRAATQARRKIGMAGWLSGFVFLPQKLRLLLRHGLPEVR